MTLWLPQYKRLGIFEEYVELNLEILLLFFCVFIFFFLGDKKAAKLAANPDLIKKFSICKTLSKKAINTSVNIKVTR